MAKKRNKSLRGLPAEHASSAAKNGMAAWKNLETAERQLSVGACNSAYTHLVQGLEQLARTEAHAAESEGRESVPKRLRNLAVSASDDFQATCVRQPSDVKPGYKPALKRFIDRVRKGR